MNDIERFEHNGNIIRIVYDESPENPKEWDNLGEIVYKENGKYTLGYESATQEELDEIANDPDNFWLPVYAYIHSGTALNTTGFSCPWDSGKCGLIWCPKSKLEVSEEESRKIFIQEVETFSKYLNGETYGFIIEDKKGNVVESCFGFYGLEDCEEEAKYAS